MMCVLIYLLLALCAITNGQLYRPSNSIFPAQALSPPSLTGQFYYMPSEFTPGLYDHTSNGFVGQIVIPGPSDDILGCRNYSSAYGMGGVPYAGNILLLIRGVCPFYDKMIFAQNLNASLIIIADDTRGSTVLMSTIRTYVDRLYIMGGSGSFLPKTPGITVSYYDGQTWLSYLQQIPFPSVPLIVNIPGTGSLDSGDRAVLRELLQSVNFTQQSPAQLATALYAGQRPWTLDELDRTDVDPCLIPLAGLVCINGRVVFMRWLTIAPSGAIPSSIGNLTHLRFWQIETSYLTSLGGDGFCELQDLQVFELTVTPTLFALPDCMTKWNKIRRFEIMDVPIENFPRTLAFQSTLDWIVFSSTRIQNVPLNLFNRSNLLYFDLSFNNIAQRLPSLSNNNLLQYVNVARNSWYGNIDTSSFDDMPYLLQLNLGYNSLNGILPGLTNTTSLQYIDVSYNNLQGGIPQTWSLLQSVTDFHAPGNKITIPVKSLVSMSMLATIDLSYNQIVNDYYLDGFAEPDALSFVYFSCSTMVSETIRLTGNPLTGTLTTGKPLSRYAFLKTLDLSHTYLSGTIPDDLLTVGVATLNLSFNNLTGSLPSSKPGVSSREIMLHGNPGLVSPIMPNWIVLSSTEYTVQNQQSYSCPTMMSTVLGLKVILDPSIFSYNKCLCDRGTFPAPAPPNCLDIPISETVIDGQVFDAIMGDTSYDQIHHFAIPKQNYSITDMWYGNNRLMSGINTIWNIKPNQTSQVRSMKIIIHLDLSLFNKPSDLISFTTVDQYGTPINGEVQVFTGLDQVIRNGVFRENWPNEVLSPVYWNNFNQSLTLLNTPLQNGGNHSVIQLQVLTPYVQVQFQSRNVEGAHMIMTYTHLNHCPITAYPDIQGTYHWDNDLQRCLFLQPLYSISKGFPILIYAFTGINILSILLILGFLFKNRNETNIKGGSIMFLYLVLFFLLFLTLTSLLYAVPGKTNTFCQLRVWGSSLPLVGILASLLAKTYRINKIFMSRKLNVKKLSDTQMVGFVIIMMFGQLIMLIIFSSLRLSEAEIVPYENHSYRLQQCSQENGFLSWLGVDIALIGGFMVIASLYAYSTRNVPAQFNESWFITIAMGSLTLICAILVPIDFVVLNNPAATTLIQGFGQNLVVSLLLLILYLPKVYFIMQKDNLLVKQPVPHIPTDQTIANNSPKQFTFIQLSSSSTPKTPTLENRVTPIVNHTPSNQTSVNLMDENRPIGKSLHRHSQLNKPIVTLSTSSFQKQATWV